MNRIYFFCIATIIVGGSFTRSLAQQEPFKLLSDVHIPMRDGVTLSADVVIPMNTTKAPVVFALSPYATERKLMHVYRFSSSYGFVMVWVNNRGRGLSQGDFKPFENEVNDTYDIIDWISKQTWCNGEVGMGGGSYLGFVQWAATKKIHPNLRTIAPMVAVAPGIDFPMTNNIFMGYWLRWLNYTTNEPFSNDVYFQDNKHWYNLYNSYYRKGVPFLQLDSLDGNVKGAFKKALAHPAYDSYWSALIPSTPEEFKNIKIPILTITGYFDSDQRGAIHYYNMHQRYGDPAFTKNHYLLIGPYTHSGAQTLPSAKVGNFKIDSAAIINMYALAFDWQDHILNDKPRPEILKDKVNCFVLGSGWKHSATLKDLSPDTLKLFLDGTNNKFKQLKGQQSPKASFAEIQYHSAITNDTIDVSKHSPVLEEEEVNGFFDEGYLERTHQIIFDSEPLSENMELIGSPVGDLFLQVKNFRDIDFAIEFYEVDAKGESYLLSQQIQRGSYARSMSKRELLKSGADYHLSLSNTYFMAKHIEKGSRIRFVFRILNSPLWQKNYGSGKDVSKETKEDAMEGVIKLLMDKKHPSAILLPGKISNVKS
jgi:hypothetical protein